MSFPPFEMLDSSGQPAGVSVDMARAMGQSLNRPIRFENIPFDGLIPSLKTGKIDVIISSLTMTEDRKKSIDFSDPYLKDGAGDPRQQKHRYSVDQRRGQAWSQHRREKGNHRQYLCDAALQECKSSRFQ